MASHLVAVLFVPRAHALVELPDTSHASIALLFLAVTLIPQADAVATEEMRSFVFGATLQAADPVVPLAGAFTFVEEASFIGLARQTQTLLLASQAIAIAISVKGALLSFGAGLFGACLLRRVTSATAEEKLWRLTGFAGPP